MLSVSGGVAAGEDRGLRRILVVDDHQAVRRALSRLVLCRPRWQVCGEASSESEGMELALSHRPHLAIVDLRMGEVGGLGLMRDIARRLPATRLLAYSILEGREAVRRCFEAGAHGFVSKHEPVEELLPAVSRLLDGRTRFPSFDPESVDVAEIGSASLI